MNQSINGLSFRKKSKKCRRRSTTFSPLGSIIPNRHPTPHKTVGFLLASILRAGLMSSPQTRAHKLYLLPAGIVFLARPMCDPIHRVSPDVDVGIDRKSSKMNPISRLPPILRGMNMGRRHLQRPTSHLELRMHLELLLYAPSCSCRKENSFAFQ
jgi:hypothetical protein